MSSTGKGKRQRSDKVSSFRGQSSASALAGRSNTTAKVPIARLQQPETGSGSQRKRIKHACVACQQQKVKCSGEVPRCKRCADLGLTCLYGLGKRAANRYVQDRLELQNNQAQALLLDLHSRSTGEDRSLIENFLETWREDTSSVPNTAQSRETTNPSSPQRTEDASVSEVGSQGSPDVLDEDVETMGIARATGYHGRSSDIQWWRRANDASQTNPEELDSRGASPEEPQGHWPLSAVNYHLDDMEMLGSSPVDCHEMPALEVAHRLLELFEESTQSEFPLVDTRWLTAAMAGTLSDSLHRATTVTEPRDSAILNMIFAIGASYAHLIGDAQGDERDHLLYFARSRQLVVGRDAFVAHPDTQDIRLAALTSFYYLCSSQVNRSWVLAGHAVRVAFALGLHVRNEDAALPSPDKEARLLLWWALWLLEHQLVTLTGRPSGIPEGSYSIERPREGQNTPTGFACQYLNLRIDLAKITQSIVDHLYKPAVATQGWASVQAAMLMLESALFQWRAQLPEAYKFDEDQVTNLPGLNRATRTLRFHFYTSVVLITRPCLCDPRRIGKLSHESQGTTQRRAEDCLLAAKNIINLLPDSFDAVHLYQRGPWYIQVSVVMQACSIIVIALSLGRLPAIVEDLLPSVQRMVTWLREMARHNAEAFRGWEQCTSALNSLAARTSMDLSEIDMSPPNLAGSTQGRSHSVFPTSDSAARAERNWYSSRETRHQHGPTTPIGQFLQDFGTQMDAGFFGQGYPLHGADMETWFGMEFFPGQTES